MKLLAMIALVFTTFGSIGQAKDLQTAIFAGGCFWCVESDFDHVEGVVETISGYTGGTLANATYKEVGRGDTGHYEAVKITFDADVVSYEELLYVFWRTIDPTDAGGQFCDRGSPYRTAVFATTDAQAVAAETSKAALDGRLSGPIVTPVLSASDFWDAEGYHQNYYQRHKLKYGFYRSRCGRDARVAQLWGDEAIYANK